MTQLFEKTHWSRARKSNMIAARECRLALTNPEGFWRYAQDDERVVQAVTFWVERARNCHGILMGRRPVIGKAVVINGAKGFTGSLYAA